MIQHIQAAHIQNMNRGSTFTAQQPQQPSKAQSEFT